jgi:hypothetical protein
VETELGHEQQAIDYLKRYLEKRPDAQDAPAARAEIEARTRAHEAAQREKAAQAERSPRAAPRRRRRDRIGPAAPASRSWRPAACSSPWASASTWWRRSARRP